MVDLPVLFRLTTDRSVRLIVASRNRPVITTQMVTVLLLPLHSRQAVRRGLARRYRLSAGPGALSSGGPPVQLFTRLQPPGGPGA